MLWCGKIVISYLPASVGDASLKKVVEEEEVKQVIKRLSLKGVTLVRSLEQHEPCRDFKTSQKTVGAEILVSPREIDETCTSGRFQCTNEQVLIKAPVYLRFSVRRLSSSGHAGNTAEKRNFSELGNDLKKIIIIKINSAVCQPER